MFTQTEEAGVIKAQPQPRALTRRASRLDQRGAPPAGPPAGVPKAWDLLLVELIGIQRLRGRFVIQRNGNEGDQALAGGRAGEPRPPTPSLPSPSPPITLVGINGARRRRGLGAPKVVFVLTFYCHRLFMNDRRDTVDSLSL